MRRCCIDCTQNNGEIKFAFFNVSYHSFFQRVKENIIEVLYVYIFFKVFLLKMKNELLK